jgi:hypothetical protein
VPLFASYCSSLCLVPAQRLTVRRHLHTIVVAAVVLIAFWSTEASALHPCPTGPDNYRELLQSEIRGRAPEPVIATFLAMPSFGTEYGFVLSQGNGAPQVTVVRFTESVWYGSVEEISPGLMSHVFSKSKIKARSQQYAISAELAGLLKSLLAKETAHIDTTSSYGLDGETYVFTTADGRCAETWSPEKGMRNELLVRTMEEIIALGGVPTQTLRSASERRLLKRLKVRWRIARLTPRENRVPSPNRRGRGTQLNC